MRGCINGLGFTRHINRGLAGNGHAGEPLQEAGQHIAQPLAVADAEGAMQRRVAKVGVNQEHACAEAGEAAGERQRAGRLAFLGLRA